MTDYIKAIAEELDEDKQEKPTIDDSLESQVASYFDSRRPDKVLGEDVTSELLHSLSLQLGETPKQKKQDEEEAEPFYPTAEGSDEGEAEAAEIPTATLKEYLVDMLAEGSTGMPANVVYRSEGAVFYPGELDGSGEPATVEEGQEIISRHYK